MKILEVYDGLDNPKVIVLINGIDYTRKVYAGGSYANRRLFIIFKGKKIYINMNEYGRLL